MTTTAMNETYINALLADASYQLLEDIEKNIPFSESKVNSELAKRLTQPLARGVNGVGVDFQ